MVGLSFIPLCDLLFVFCCRFFFVFEALFLPLFHLVAPPFADLAPLARRGELCGGAGHGEAMEAVGARVKVRLLRGAKPQAASSNSRADKSNNGSDGGADKGAVKKERSSEARSNDDDKDRKTHAASSDDNDKNNDSNSNNHKSDKSNTDSDNKNGDAKSSAKNDLSKKRRKETGESRPLQAQWLRGTVEAYRPTSGKHLVVFDIVYGRCVRGGVLLTELDSSQFAGEPSLPKEAYRQQWIDRRSILVVPSVARSAGVLCQPWARCVFYDGCICSESSPTLSSRSEWPPNGLESATDPVTQCLRWAAWLDLASLETAGLLQRIEQLPLVCICRVPHLPENDPASAGESMKQCSTCGQHYHLDCIVKSSRATGEKSDSSTHSLSPSTSSPANNTTAAATTATGDAKMNVEPVSISSAAGKEPKDLGKQQQPHQPYICAFCEAHHLAGVSDRDLKQLTADPDQIMEEAKEWGKPDNKTTGTDSQATSGPAKDAEPVSKSASAKVNNSTRRLDRYREIYKIANQHLRKSPPVRLNSVCEWRYWNVPLSLGGKLADDIPVPKGEWVYCLRHLRHLCGAEHDEFVRLEIEAISHASTPQWRCPRQGLEVTPYGKSSIDCEAARRKVLTGESGRLFPCTTNGMARLLSEQAQPSPVLKRRSSKWKKAGRSKMENRLRRMALETLFALDGAMPAARYSVPPSGQLVMHSPRGGYLGKRKQHYEVEFSAGAFSALPPLGDHEGGVAPDGTRYVRKQVGTQGTPEFTCARVRPRSEADHRRSSARPCPVVGPALDNRLPLRSLYRTEKTSARARQSGSAAARKSAAESHPPSFAASHAGAGASGKTSYEDQSKRRLQLRGVADALSADLSTKHLTLGREKRLRFGKSPIHAWGVFAEEPLSANEFVIEYKGELIRPILTDLREKRYEARGVPDYMFRIDADVVVDATMRGSLARFINHSCDPNCFTNIINHKGVRKIVIYTKRSIEPGEELSYDYKFPIEKDPALKVPCFCGAPNCRGTMN